MKILVTGACGFIASHLVRALVAQGHEVTGIDSLEEQVHGKNAVLKGVPGVEYFVGSVSESLYSKCMERQYDAVFHLAARVGVGQAQYNLMGYVSGNVAETADLLQTWITDKRLRPGRLIVASSMSIYGEGPSGEPSPLFPGMRVFNNYDQATGTYSYVLRGVRETDPITNPNQYALTKYAQEVLCLNFGQAFGVTTTALRFFNCFGPHQSLSNPYTGVAALFAARLLHDKGGLIYEDGTQTRDFIHVNDIVGGLIATLHAPAGEVAGQAINLGTGRATDLLTLHRLLAGALGKGHIEPVVTGVKRSGDIRHCHADISKATRVLGWVPRVRLEDGIDEYCQWLRTVDTSAVLERVEAAWQELSDKGLVTA